APVATSSNETYRLALFSLAPSGWVEVGDLGAAPAAARGDAALAVVDSTVHVALRDAERPGRVRVLRQTPQQTWADAAAVDVGDDATAVKLLGGGPVPVVWALKPTGGYSLHWVGPQWVRSESLSPPAKVRASEVAAALAIERVRVVHYNTDGQLLERTFEPLPASLAEAPGASPATVPA